MYEEKKSIVRDFFLNFKYLKRKLKETVFFNFLYGSKNNYILKLDNLQTIYSTEDEHSKHWFFPRYSGKRIHEPVVTKMLIDTLSKTDIFVDVGTHLGYFTCIAGKICKEGKIYGFELDKNAFDLLNKNISLNNLKNVEVYNYGVSDKKGYVKIPKITLPSPVLSFSKDCEDGDYRLVKSISLDDFFLDKKHKPNVIKIDVEGSELFVLKGMKNLLKDEKLTIFLEIHGRSLHKFDTDSKEIISFIKKRGYLIYEILNHRRNMKDMGEILKEIEEDNLIDYNTMLYITKNMNSV